jgi:hypothetical protein
MTSNYKTENVLFLFSYIIGTIVFGLVIGFVSLLISYAILIEMLNVGLIPTDFIFYSLTLTYIDAVKHVFGWVSGWLF